MHLTREEENMLNGGEGRGIQKAMRILTALGEIYGADQLIEVGSVQVSGVSYRNLGDAGLDFLRGWAGEGARVRVPSVTLNPAGMDLVGWRRLGISEEFAGKQLEVVEAFKEMGIVSECTCTPYFVGNRPGFGDHIAWSESSAVSFANSVLGARTNRESGVSALASALTGRTPDYGYHLDENRRADVVVDVCCEVDGVSDFGALGYLVGRRVGGGVPYFRGAGSPTADELKSLGASMAASGAVALYHVERVTPEAKKGNMVREDAVEITVESLDGAYQALNSGVQEIDIVALGCPHASLDEVGEIASLLEGRRVRSELWVATSRSVRDLAREEGFVEVIEQAGGRVVVDTCMVVAPLEELGFRSLATNAGKAAFYCPSHCGVEVRFGSTRECINAAVKGRWGV